MDDNDDVIVISEVAPGYVISLANLDLHSLPVLQSDSLINSGPQTVKIFVKSDDDDAELLEKKKCFTCDVEVPAAFLEDHLQSSLHQAYARIAKTALERNRQPETVSGHGTSFSCSNLFYCTFCSCAVKLDNSEAHTNTEKHRIAVKHANFMNTLALLYEDKNNYSKLHDELIKDLEKTVEKSGGKSKTADHVNVEIEKKTSATDTSVADCTKKKRERKKKKKNLQETEKLATNDKSNDTVAVSARNNILGLKAYLSIINEIPDYDVEYFDQNHAKITVTGNTFKIDLDKFHSYKHDRYMNITKCEICEMTIVNTEDHIYHKEKYIKELKRRHSREKHHILMITKPVSTDCIRQLTGTWNHCLVCNTVFDDKYNLLNTLRHIVTPEHDEMINAAVIEKVKTPRKSLQLKETILEPAKTVTKVTLVADVPKYYCAYCKFTAPNKKAKSVHDRTTNHRFNEWLANYKNASVIHYHLKPTNAKDAVICTICHETIKGTVAINNHVKTKEHMKNYNKFLEKNLMKSISERNTFCKACCIHVSCLDVVEHIVSEEHKTFVAQDVRSRPPPKTSEPKLEVTIDNNNSFFMEVFDEKRLKCKLCNVPVNNKLSNTMTHTNTHLHNTNYDYFLRKNQLDSKVINTIFLYYCKACQIDVSKIAIFAHTNSSEHIKNLQNMFPKTLSDTASEENLRESIKEQKQYLMKKIDENILQCQICETELFDKNTCILDHIKCAKHKAFYESLLVEEEITKTGNFYFCNTCKVALPQKELKHIYSEEHKINAAKNPSCSKTAKNKSEYYFCEICGVNVINSSFTIKIHEAGSTHKNNVTNLQQTSAWKPLVNSSTDLAHKSVAAITKTNEAAKAAPTSGVSDIVDGICKICQTGLLQSPKCIQNHINGYKHRQAVLKITNMFLCGICNIKVPNDINQIRQHFKGSFHKEAKLGLKNSICQVTKTENTVAKTQGSSCKICNIKMPNDTKNIKEHFNGTAHKQEVIKLNKQIAQLTSTQKTSTAGQEYVCDVCKIKVPNDPINIREHFNGTVHKNAIERENQKQNYSKCNICEVWYPQGTNHVMEHLMRALDVQFNRWGRNT